MNFQEECKIPFSGIIFFFFFKADPFLGDYFLLTFQVACENLDQTSPKHIFNTLTLRPQDFIFCKADCITSAQSHPLSCYVQLCTHLCCKHGMGCRIIHKGSRVLVSALGVNPSFCTNTVNTSVTAVLCWSGIEHYWFVFVPQCHEFYHIITNSSICLFSQRENLLAKISLILLLYRFGDICSRCVITNLFIGYVQM